MQHASNTSNTSNTYPTTLGQFEAAYAVNKGTVSRKAKALNLDVSKGLTTETHDRLCQEFKVGSYFKLAEKTETKSLGNGLAIVDSSNQEIEPGKQFTSLDIGKTFKGMELGPNLSNLDGLDQVLDQLTNHLETTAQKHLQSTAVKQQQVKLLKLKLEKAKTAALKAEITAEFASLLNANLNQEVEEITEGFTDLGASQGED